MTIEIRTINTDFNLDRKLILLNQNLDMLVMLTYGGHSCYFIKWIKSLEIKKPGETKLLEHCAIFWEANS